MNESLRQHDMFSGEAVDTRTRSQRQKDKLKRAPKQQTMFYQREMAQFGVNPRPLLPLSPHMILPMLAEDPRTEEEIEADRERRARTGRLGTGSRPRPVQP